MNVRTRLAYLLPLAMTIGGSGCSAIYTFERTADGGCHGNVYSRRDVAGPVTFKVGADCTIEVGAGSLTGGQITVQELGTILGALTALTGRPVPVVVPEPSPTPDE